MTGAFVLGEVFAIAERLEAIDAWGYDTVYDLRELIGAPTQADISELADYVQRLVGRRPRGRVVVVTSSLDVVHAIRAYAALNGGGLRIRAFDSIEDAEQWLEESEATGF
jgi:hypothetical protein